MRAPARPVAFRRLVGLLVTAGLTGCGQQASGLPPPAEAGDPGAIHIHGLGVDPADGSLFLATHTGLFRAAPAERRARRVADRRQDTMGFTVVGPNHFLGSGHPDGLEDLPPFLGLIESRDAGRTWRPVSLQGEVDFHVLESSGGRIYGYGSDWKSREPRFLSSSDGGRSWRSLRAPEPLISLTIAPDDPRSLVVSGERGLHRSSDAGRSWTPVDAPGPGLLARASDAVVLVDLEGNVWRGADPAAGRWRPAGAIGGAPAALDADAEGELFVALHDGVIKHSADGGRTWSVRAQP